MKLDVYLIPYIKINSKLIKGLNVSVKTIKLSEKKVGEKLHDIGFGSGFLEKTPKEQAKKVKIDRTTPKFKNSLHQRIQSTE